MLAGELALAARINSMNESLHAALLPSLWTRTREYSEIVHGIVRYYTNICYIPCEIVYFVLQPNRELWAVPLCGMGSNMRFQKNVLKSPDPKG